MKKSLKSACSYSVNEIYNHSLIHIRKETQNPAPFSILIVGKDSYIGTNTEKHLVSYGNFKIHTLDAVNLVPIPEYFKGYDAVFYVAGIVHQKESRKNISLYYKVNRDLAVSTAKSAKKASEVSPTKAISDTETPLEGRPSASRSNDAKTTSNTETPEG